MKILSLFDGVSCGLVALKRCGFHIEQYHSYEIDMYAIKVSHKNHGEQVIQHGDVFSLRNEYESYNNMDIIIGGSPCTYWSIARGKNRETTSEGLGYELFMQYADAVKNIRPKYFLYENNNSISKDIQAKITEELGVEPIMINSNLLSAQNRKRLYWTNIPNVTQPEDLGLMIEDVIDDSIIYCMSYEDYSPRETRNYIQFDVSGKGHNSQQDRAYYVEGKFSCFPSARAVTKRKITDKSGFYRNLTLNEVEALQNLPANYTLLEGKDFSLNKSMCAIGNGWTVDVISHILSFIPKEKVER